MEVHPHTHPSDPDSHRGKKKFTHYLWEFLMLFLAVFCGFLAENQREHLVELRHEKEFMKSLVRDLELDTLQLDNLKKYRNVRLSIMDSLFVFFANNSAAKIPARQYGLILQLFGHAAFFQNSGTLDQLRNSGGLRLIRNRTIVDSIEAYDQQIKRMSLRDIYETDFMFENKKLAQKLFEGRTALKILADTAYFKKQVSSDLTIPFNEQYMDEYLNSLITFQNIVKQNMGLQAFIKNKAGTLLILIKKEYHLE